MLKVRIFRNEPCGLTWERLQEILPRLGGKYKIDVETVTRTREEFQSAAYQALGLPAAPAVMVADEVAAQGPGISEENLEAVIRKHLGLAPVQP